MAPATRETLPLRGAGLIALLTALAALGQFASSVYLPSMPAMQTGLDASRGAVQATMTAYLAAFAIFQIVYGPLADRFGRRPIMLLGGVLFVVGSLLCMTAQSIGFVIVGRMVQAMGACAGVVASRAVTRDLFEGPELSKVMAAIAMAFSAVPAVAPVIGGALQELIGWRASFAAATGFGVVVLLAVTVWLRETNRSTKVRLSFGTIWSGYRTVAGNPQFRAYALTTAATMGGLFAFLTGAPAVAIQEAGLSPMEFGLYPALSIPGFIISGTLVRKLVAKTGDAYLMKVGAAVAALGCLAMLAIAAGGLVTAWSMMVCMMIFVCGMGFVFSLGHAGALRHFPERAGVASGLMGVLQLGSAAVFSGVVAAVASWGALGFAAGMAVAGVAAFVFSRGCR
ncbi:MAG: multidrug effflux MFS transporter [Alphaproteobacteria bacterium]|nr:multidrug effflux MFS transporter [Alphaproteobacteria bacterium]MCB9928587.1 multidrug effflux MFS transporter [Alphaproteobacteria bacterium]